MLSKGDSDPLGVSDHRVESDRCHLLHGMDATRRPIHDTTVTKANLMIHTMRSLLGSSQTIYQVLFEVPSSKHFWVD
jgi:hypothetical protein